MRLKRAPCGKAPEEVCGAEKGKCTAQEGPRGSVRCEKVNVHRTGKPQRIYAVHKGKVVNLRVLGMKKCDWILCEGYYYI